MDRYNKRKYIGRPRHDRNEIKTAQGGRDRNKDYMLQYQKQTQWHPKTGAASWNEGRETENYNSPEEERHTHTAALWKTEVL